MWRVFAGAALILGGIAAFIETHSHRPAAAKTLEQYDAITRIELAKAGVTPRPASGLSPDAYDVVHIGAWALVIFGAALLGVGLIGYWSAQRHSPGSN
jgi:xanthine/CO dehydrogenase XdhC/CoxF family maturation factor